MRSRNIPIIILGGTGYVAGELIRLLAQHPGYELEAVASTSAAGEAIAATFPHLAPALGDMKFTSMDDTRALMGSKRTLGVFSALPHGESASVLADWLATAKQTGCDLKVVDLSADLRFRSAEEYKAVYGKDHTAPELLDQFVCALPDLAPEAHGDLIAHPGCFTTSVVLGVTPLLKAGLIESDVFVSSVTGSTGAGRQPRAGTHHPERHSGLWAYEPLKHRHIPEMERLVQAASGTRPEISFIPHSGPFARGIHTTILATLSKDVSDAEVLAAYEAVYRGNPFVSLRKVLPSVKDAVGTNMCFLGVRREGNKVFVASVIDNLTKGAAGGGVQWMNILFGFEPSAGLLLPGVGWT